MMMQGVCCVNLVPIDVLIVSESYTYAAQEEREQASELVNRRSYNVHVHEV